MSLFLSFLGVVKFFSISLGVGAVTIAVINFFTAIADGVIDETERRMMGVVYAVLEVAMALVLLSSMVAIFPEYKANGLGGLSGFSYSELFVLSVLLLSTFLMSARLVSTTIGPAIQVGSWYTLATMTGLSVIGYTDFTFVQFLLGYFAWMILAIGIVNAIMAILKVKKSDVKI